MSSVIKKLFSLPIDVDVALKAYIKRYNMNHINRFNLSAHITDYIKKLIKGDIKPV